jgi:cytochrome oxidase Cu insertion factor (SCO1/SenC/PrrC family)
MSETPSTEPATRSEPATRTEPATGAAGPSRRTLTIRVLAAGMLVLAAWGLTQLGGTREEDLPSLFPVPAFELTDQDGATFRSETLRGRVWIASFLFTSCSQACPTLAAQLANVRTRLAPHGDRFHVVSVTVDPDNDTPARLREFADRFGGSSQWTLLTGTPEDVRATTERAFFQPEARRTEIEAAPGYDILHGTGVLLVDRDGRCRGLYPTDGEGIERLVRDVERLLE